MHTTEKLALALEAEGAPTDMIVKAREGYYHDFLSPLAFPETQLLADARLHGLGSIADGVIRGEWDATKEESDDWAKSPEGQETFRDLIEGR